MNPTVVDARTEITTELLSDEGFAVTFTDDGGRRPRRGLQAARVREALLRQGDQRDLLQDVPGERLRDPVSGEIGKSIIFSVSQNHAAKLVQVLNRWPIACSGKYQSDFAVQVTSSVPDAQQFTINFANNNLLGSGNFIPTYKTSKARSASPSG